MCASGNHIASTKSAKEAWDAIIKVYEDSGLTRKAELLKQLVQLKFSILCKTITTQW